MNTTKLQKSILARAWAIMLSFIMCFTFIPWMDNEGATSDAATTIKIGDYVVMGTYYGEAILWRCVDIDENGPLMLSDKILCLKAFDASGTVTTGSHGRGYTSSGTKGYYRQEWGSNCWEDSNMRCWLNSTASAGSVTWDCGNKPDETHVWNGYNEYDKEAGFLSNFTQSERNCMKKVSQYELLDMYEYDNMSSFGSTYHTDNYDIADCVTNFDQAYKKEITDTMFLLDVKQVNKVYQNSATLGTNYYIGEPTSQCVSNSEYTSSDLATGKKWHYWLRSPDASSGGSDVVRYVYSDGFVDNYCAYISHIGVRPAFYLNLSSTSFVSGNGSVTSPYTVAGGSPWNPDINPSDDYVYKTGNFTTRFSGSEGITESLPIYYDDSIFTQASNKYNHRLAQYSLAMALAGFTANSGYADWSKSGRKDSKLVKSRMQYINELYENLGYKDVTEYNYEYSLNETSDKVAFSMARKVIKDGDNYDTVISVILRGGEYGAEWGSNFNVGSGTYHRGWDTASTEVYNELKSYISSLKTAGKIFGDVKLHITGYSRSAAVANILAGKIDNNYSEFTNSKDNIYAYTFATPCGVNKKYVSNCNSATYNNIFNIVNAGDAVPRVVMDFWGYARYGVNKFFNINASNNVYNTVTSYRNKFCSSDWTAKKNAKQTSDVEDIVNALSYVAPNTAYYTPSLEYAVKDLLAYKNSRTNGGEAYSSLSSYCMNKYGPNNIQKARTKSSPYFSKIDYRVDALINNHIITWLSQSKIKEYIDGVKDLLCDMHVSMVYHGVNPETAYQDIRTIIDGVDAWYLELGAVAECILGPYLINKAIPDWLPLKASTTQIVEAHQPETYAAWMFALGNDDTNVFGSYSYTTTTVKTNKKNYTAMAEKTYGNEKAASNGLSVTVYDKLNNEVCKIVNGEVVSCDILDAQIKADGGIKLCTVDGEDAYTIKINSTSSESIALSSSKTDLDGNELKRVVYDEVPLNNETVITGEIAGAQMNSDNGGNKTTIDGEVLAAEDLNKFTISATAEGSGTVNGVSTASYGDEITLTATPIGNAEFNGWYDKTSKLLSSNTAITMTVKSNIDVLAKFETLPVTFESSDAFHLIDGKLTGIIYAISGKAISGTIRLSVLDSGGSELCKEETQVDLSANNSHSVSYNMDLSQYSDVKKIKAEFISDSKTVASYEKDVEKVSKHNYKDESIGAYSNSITYNCYCCDDCGYSYMSDYTDWGNLVDSGDCGTSGHESDVTWKFFDSGNLIICGEGSVKEYEEYPWSAYYDQISKVWVSDGVTSLGSLETDENLANTEFVVDSENTNYSSIDGVLFNKSGTELIKYPNGNERVSYTLPSTVTKVCDEALKNNSTLTAIALDDNLTTIGKEAFYGCTGITEITIPSNVSTIGDRAFAGCSSLSKVTFKGNAPTSFGESVFGSTEDLASGFTIIPPEDLSSWKTDKYNKDTGTWNGYKIDITEDDDDDSGSLIQRILKVFKSFFSSFKSIFSKLFGFLK